MATMLSVTMDEGGAYVITISCTDEDGNAKNPKTLNWTLTTEDGQTIINNREDVEITNPTSEEVVVLNGDDCMVLPHETSRKIIRLFTVKGTYDSDLGTDLNLRGQCYIQLENYPAIE